MPTGSITGSMPTGGMPNGRMLTGSIPTGGMPNEIILDKDIYEKGDIITTSELLRSQNV